MKDIAVFWLFLSCFLAIETGKSITFQDCGSKGAQVTGVTITPCDSEPCTLKRGTNVTSETDFKSLINSKTATLNASVIVFGQTIPVALDQPDACKSLTCPLVAGRVYVLKGTTLIPTTAPPISVPIVFQYQMTGDNNEVIFCIQYKVKIS